MSEQRKRSPHIAKVVHRNIATLLEMRRQLERSKKPQDRVADGITAFSGSIPFFYLHVVWFTLWIALNVGLFPVVPFDPFPFGLLTMIVSLEAIFLSTFVLISQNRFAQMSDQRADLDVQTNLLAEYEVTRVLKLVDAIADHLKLEAGKNPELDELEHDIPLEEILKEMEGEKKKLRL